jgi:hypothetical protein
MSSHRNPYNPKSNYFKIFGFVQKTAIVTIASVFAYCKSALHLADKAAHASQTVLMSPRKDSLGNASAKGKDYFMEKLVRKEIKGVKQPQQFRLRWRERQLTGKVEQVKKSKKVSKPAPKPVVKQTAVATA